MAGSAPGRTGRLRNSCIDGLDESAGERAGRLREFLHLSVQPLSGLIALELSDKLDLFDLDFGFDRLFASDIQARRRALKAMIEAGFEPAEVARLVGYPELAG